MNTVTIRFKNITEISAEQNGDCFITNNKPNFPDDLSEIIVESNNPMYNRTYYNAELVECAAVDDRYWFSFYELSETELKQKQLEETIEILTGCLLEMSETVYA